MQTPQYFIMAMGLSGLLGYLALLLGAEGRRLFAYLPNAAKVMPILFLLLIGFGSDIIPLSIVTYLGQYRYGIFYAIFFAFTAMLTGRFMLYLLAPGTSGIEYFSGRLPVVLTLYFIIGTMTLGLPISLVAMAKDGENLTCATFIIFALMAFMNCFAVGIGDEDCEKSCEGNEDTDTGSLNEEAYPTPPSPEETQAPRAT